jgi:glycolate oxidase iron-sulfur subunit
MITESEVSWQLQHCNRCGGCMSVCPVYRETGEEGTVARGRLSLIEARERNELNPSRKFLELLETCLLCGACAHYCPNGIQADRLIQWQRSQLREHHRPSWRKLLTLNTLEAAGRWPRLLAGCGSLAQALLCASIPADSGLHLRFPLAELSQRRYLPKVSPSPFLGSAPARLPGSGARVGLFVGCVGNYLKPGISEAGAQFLQRCGFQVVIPAEQRCCGMAAWETGDSTRAKVLAEHNGRLFLEAGCEWVVSACGTCSTHLRLHLPDLLTDCAPEAARFFASRATDLTAFIVRQLRPEQLRAALISPDSFLASYHDPCHLLHHQGIFAEPRQALGLLPEITLKELPGAHQCCGHGGLFNVDYYHLSTRIADRKTAQVKEGALEVLATGCMGCLLQLQEGNWRNGLGLTVCHLVEVLMGRVGK